jgi:hypothetical protein
MSVTFTASTLGPTASSFTLTSSSGVTGSGASSPLTLQEVATGTYTYSVSGTNANGTGPSSAASNSVVVASVFAPSGAYDSIATVTVGSTAQSTITFSSIPSTYQHLQVRAFARCSSASIARNIQTQINGDTGSNYQRHYLLGNGSTASAGADAYSVIFAGTAVGTGSLASTFGVSIFDYLDYSSTNKNKTVRVLNGYEDNTQGQSYLTSGLWLNTAAINSLSFTIEGGFNFTQYTSFALYGIKGS